MCINTKLIEVNKRWRGVGGVQAAGLDYGPVEGHSVIFRLGRGPAGSLGEDGAGVF